MPGCPRMKFGLVDVRDVADLHLRAMTNPAAKGERFLAIAGDFVSIQQIARTLKRRLGAAGREGAARELLPDWLVRLVALADPAVAQIAPELGKLKNATTKRPSACSAGPRARPKMPSSPPPKACAARVAEGCRKRREHCRNRRAGRR